MDNLDERFLGKFAQPGIDICEPIEGFDKAPHEFTRCVDDLIKKHKQLRKAIDEVMKWEIRDRMDGLTIKAMLKRNGGHDA